MATATMPEQPDFSQVAEETSTFNMRQLAVRFLDIATFAAAEQSAASTTPGDALATTHTMAKFLEFMSLPCRVVGMAIRAIRGRDLQIVFMLGLLRRA